MFYRHSILSFTNLAMVLLTVVSPPTDVLAGGHHGAHHRFAPIQTFPISLHGTGFGIPIFV